jgi:hypothetical protein
VGTASVGPLPAPKGATNCRPEVKRATATEFELVSPSKPSNFIMGELGRGGQLAFMVENLPKDGTGCPGRWMFDQMMRHFGLSVAEVQGFWIGPLSDNLKEVNSLTAAGIPLEAAAARTWTGKRAADWGYTQPQVVKGFGRNRRAAGFIPAGTSPAASRASLFPNALRGCSKCVHVFIMKWRCLQLASPGFQPFARWQIR